MSAAGQFIKRLLASFRSGKPDNPSVRFRIVDSSRNTELASNVEIADTGAKRSKGLLGRNGLGLGEGLWIVPCESIHTFGMRFPIDVIYLDRQHRIRKIRRNISPWRVSACLTAHSVIELASGAVGEQDAQPGDVVEFFPVSPEEKELVSADPAKS